MEKFPKNANLSKNILEYEFIEKFHKNQIYRLKYKKYKFGNYSFSKINIPNRRFVFSLKYRYFL